MSTLRQLLRTAVRSVAFLSAGLMVFSAASAQIVIDDFQTPQTITSAAPTVVGPESGILGTFRTGRAKPASSLASMTIGSGSAAFTASDGDYVVLEWDGDDDASGYSETGLNGVNLTTDGSAPQIGLRFDVQTEGPFAVLIEVSTNESHASSKVVSGFGPTAVTVLWLDFTDCKDTGCADFSDVGGVLIVFNGIDDFAIGPVTTFPDDDIVLPVELVSFDAVTSGSTVNLAWNVASELDNAGFYVEHRFASAAKDWEEIGFVASKGNTNDGASYGFSADIDLAGRHEFRLRQVDLDGTFTYSPAVEVSLDVPGSFVLGQAYPNPFNPTTNFSLSLAKGQNVEVAVFDLLGRAVLTLHDGYLEGSQSHVFNIDASNLTTGMYVVKASGEVATSATTITLVK